MTRTRLTKERVKELGVITEDMEEARQQVHEHPRRNVKSTFVTTKRKGSVLERAVVLAKERKKRSGEGSSQPEETEASENETERTPSQSLHEEQHVATTEHVVEGGGGNDDDASSNSNGGDEAVRNRAFLKEDLFTNRNMDKYQRFKTRKVIDLVWVKFSFLEKYGILYKDEFECFKNLLELNWSYSEFVVRIFYYNLKPSTMNLVLLQQ